MSMPAMRRALEIVTIARVEAILAAGQGREVFTAGEWDFAHAKSDPARRLAARYAAKLAATSLLGTEAALIEIEVVRHPGRAPQLRMHGAARAALERLGGRPIVSLTHSRRHAAALVLLLDGEQA
jgi:holo-[acyl-carrier protein] synthase